MTDAEPGRSDWWRVVEEHLEQLEDADHDDLADPWAGLDEPAPGLTEAQRALLTGDYDQPQPARFQAEPGEGSHTGLDDQPATPRLADADDTDGADADES